MSEILIIDDEKDSQFLFTQQFRKWIRQGRVELKYAENRESARVMLKADSTKSRIILCDVNLPDGDGIELMKEIRNKYPTDKVIMMTGFLNRDLEKISLEAGALAYFVKPIPFPELMLLIEQFLE